jgi:splicing factor 3A subunit 3
MPEAPTEAAQPDSMNDLVFDIKGTAHLSLFYDNDRYQEWRRQKKLEVGKKPSKHKVVVADSDEALRKFSGEECFGQYLDLYDVHRALFSLPNRGPDYVGLLEMLARKDFGFAPRDGDGEKVLELLVSKLSSFVERSEPFFDLAAFRESSDQAFAQSIAPTVVETSAPNYCEYCERQFQTEEVFVIHQGHKSHARNVAKAEALGGLPRFLQERRARKRRYDALCFSAANLLSHLQTKLSATIENCKRRQTLPASVIQAEQNLDAPIVFDESDDESESHFYNPKGLPLGWDGKPIPYWLYKLHGLSVEYKCEICGDRSYWGALAFERHFFDNRHMNCLKALGIPPTRHFVYVTGVNEAIALFEKIKRSLTREVWQRGDEEIETDDGHVMSLKIYEDLVRQGILKPK